MADGTPRKAASESMTSDGNITATGSNQDKPIRDDSVAGAGQSDYKRKSTSLASDNLPLKRQPESSQSTYRPGSNGSAGNPKGVD